MPEGDTLFRTAAGLRPYLVGRTVTAARTGGPGAVPQVQRIVGREITAVDALGKNLLIRFDNGLELRTHLRMNGSWHRYRPGEAWRRPPARARLVLEVPGAVAVCFDAPVVELLEQRAEAIHAPSAASGRTSSRRTSTRTRRCAACATRRGPPWPSPKPSSTSARWPASATSTRARSCGSSGSRRSRPLPHVADEALGRLVATASGCSLSTRTATRGPERVTTAGDRGAPGPLYVYGRTGRPCRRCRTPIARASQGRDLPRSTFWCPTCQPGPD